MNPKLQRGVNELPMSAGSGSRDPSSPVGLFPIVVSFGGGTPGSLTLGTSVVECLELQGQTDMSLLITNWSSTALTWPGFDAPRSVGGMRTRFWTGREGHLQHLVAPPCPL